MLYLAWYLDNYKWEILAYEGIACQYFYLGDHQKAEHYKERVMRGKSENQTSVVRRLAESLIK